MKVFLVVNTGRRRRGPEPDVLRRMRDVFRRRNVECRMELSRSVEMCRELLADAVREGYDSLWIGGGDGTVNHILNATVGQFASYGVVPMGTVNGLARALGTPRDPVEAVEWLLDGEPTNLDLGMVGDRYFVLYATIGFHAAVFHGTNPRLKRLIGRSAFFAAGAVQALRARTLPRFEVVGKKIGSVTDSCPRSANPSETVAASAPFEHVDSARTNVVELEEPRLAATTEPPSSDVERIHREGYSLVLSNLCNFSGFGAVREGDLCDSSFLQGHLFESSDLWPMLRFFAAMRYRRPATDDPGVEHFRVSELTVRSEKPLWLQVDGEPVHLADDREFQFICVPKAIQVLWNRQAVIEAAEPRTEVMGNLG